MLDAILPPAPCVRRVPCRSPTASTAWPAPARAGCQRVHRGRHGDAIFRELALCTRLPVRVTVPVYIGNVIINIYIALLLDQVPG